MLKIEKGIVYLKGIPSKNPELIGLAFLDVIELDPAKAKKLISKKEKL